MTAAEWQFVWFTLEMAMLSTAVVIPVGLCVAWGLGRLPLRARLLGETIVALPLVLPPVATGLVLLKLLGRYGPVGSRLYDLFGIEIVFTWRAVVIALAVMSFPLFVRAARTALNEVDPGLQQIARTLGAGEGRIFFTITLPLARRGVFGGAMLAFARALGEFGATILVAGNIPGQTTTLPVAIYEAVQLGNDTRAYALAGVSALLAFLALWASEYLVRRSRP